MLNAITIVNGTGVAFACVRMLIGAFSVIYLLNKGVSLQELGWLKAFQGFVLVFIDIPLSHIADQYSRKFSICLSILTAFLWLTITGLAENFWIFFIAEFFNALSLGLMSGTFSAYLYDMSKEYDQSKVALEVFSTYQKYSFFFMGIVSVIGSILYANNVGNVWFISAGLMIVVFIISLYLPSDKKNKKEGNKGLIDVGKEIFQFFFKTTNYGKNFLLINLSIAILSQILIQYWQVLLPDEAFHKSAMSFGVIFFCILNVQALAGLVLQKLNDEKKILKIGLSCLALCFILILGVYLEKFTPFVIVLAIILLFFLLAIMSSLILAKVVEFFPKENKSTLLSTIAVLSKVGMFVFMPICAILIAYSNVLFTLGTAIVLFGFYSYLFKKEPRLVNK